jgi:hypothetical protein
VVTGGLELQFWRAGREYSAPTVSQFTPEAGAIVALRADSGRHGPAGDLFVVNLHVMMIRASGWVLAMAQPVLNMNHFTTAPVLFRFAEEPDPLPTGVLAWDVPVFRDWSADPVPAGVEGWHVTFRGCGAR